MATITFKCPNCGGGLVFDPSVQKFRCEFCNSVFTQNELDALSPDQTTDRKDTFDYEETPEEQLIRRLKEYQAFKESAGQMKSFEAVALNLFAKLPEEYPLPPPQIELTGLDMNGLMRAIRRIIARRSRTEDPGRVTGGSV